MIGEEGCAVIESTELIDEDTITNITEMIGGLEF